MKVRIRHAGGASTIDVPPESTMGDVAVLIETTVPSLVHTQQIWKIGYPPKVVPSSYLAEDPFLKDVNMIHVSLAKKLVMVEQQQEQAKKMTDQSENEIPTIDFNNHRRCPENNNTNTTTMTMTTTTTTPPQSSSSSLSLSSSLPPAMMIDPSNVDGKMVRRIMDADNSCLFNSIGYTVRNQSRKEAMTLRQAVGKEILDHPAIYTEAMLGKSPQEYVSFITDPQAWGGQIELLVFSRLFQIEIAALDIIRNRVDIYGGDSGSGKEEDDEQLPPQQSPSKQQRIFVIYDGIHYDALAYTFQEGLPEEMDITLFSPKDDVALQKAMDLCAECHHKKAFTDTSHFTLRCIVCQQGLMGANEAQAHAQITGHTNFAEFSS